MTADLVELLAWRAPEFAFGRHRAELMACVGGDVSAALADLGPRFGCQARAAATRQRLDDLDDHALVRILGAPEVCRAAGEYHKSPDAAFLDRFATWLDVEQALAEGTDALGAAQWSALGDHRLPGQPDQADEWGVHGRLAADSAACGIVVDFDSPAARVVRKPSGDRDTELEAPAPMPPCDRRISRDKIDRALAALAVACPPAYALVTTQIRVITPRNDSAHAGAYTSASSRTTIGRCRLSNPHSRAATVPRLAGALVHEAIHAFLYTQERAQPLVTDWQRAFDTNATSPWSGTVLSLPTYLHACFVWHALRALWRLPAMMEQFGEQAVEAELARAEHGFGEAVTREIEGARELVAPRIWGELERMSHAA